MRRLPVQLWIHQNSHRSRGRDSPSTRPFPPGADEGASSPLPPAKRLAACSETKQNRSLQIPLFPRSLPHPPSVLSARFHPPRSPSAEKHARVPRLPMHVSISASPPSCSPRLAPSSLGHPGSSSDPPTHAPGPKAARSPDERFPVSPWRKGSRSQLLGLSCARQRSGNAYPGLPEAGLRCDLPAKHGGPSLSPRTSRRKSFTGSYDAGTNALPSRLP